LTRLRPARVLAYAILLLWSAVCLFPIYWVLLESFKTEGSIMHGPRYLPFVDFQPSLNAWRFLFLDSTQNLLLPLWNAFVVSVCGAVIATSAACLLIYSITRQPTRRSHMLLWATLATRILPPFIIIIPLYLTVQPLGLLDTRAVLILTYAAINLPVAAWLLLPVFGPAATEQEEAATLEGASNIYIVWDILLPSLAKGLVAVLLVVFILCWNEYILAVYLTAGKASVLTPWMVSQLSLKEAQVGGDAEEWAHLSAAIILMIAPLLLFTTVAMQRVFNTVAAK
jgi:multiple sugar transport system permease protein